MKFTVNNYFDSLKIIFEKINIEDIEKFISRVEKKFIENKKIITCGNGGSAYNASHFITDWNKMVNLATNKKFFGFSLCDNLGLITAYSNDLDYGQIFSGQLKCILNKDDLLICISGSGNSKNVINAAKFANEQGAETLCLVGYDGGELKKICKYNVHVPSFDMQICEDIHLMIGHMIMKKLCGSVIN